MKKCICIIIITLLILVTVSCSTPKKDDFPTLRVVAFSSGTGIYYFKLNSMGNLEVSYGDRRHFKDTYNAETIKNKSNLLKVKVKKEVKILKTEMKRIKSLENEIYKKKTLYLPSIYAATDTWAIYLLFKDKLYSFYAGESKYKSIDEILKQLKIYSPLKISEEVFLVD